MKRWISGVLLFLLLAGTALTTVGCGEEESRLVTEEMFYVGMWEADDHNVIQLLTDGSFLVVTSTSGDQGTYKIVGDEVIMTSETGPQYTYELYGDYLLAEAYTGDKISGDTMKGTYEIVHGGYGIVMEFSEDGTVTRRVYVTDMMDNRISGTYTIKDGVITCDFLIMGTYRFVIKDGVMYDAYEHVPNYRETLDTEEETEEGSDEENGEGTDEGTDTEGSDETTDTDGSENTTEDSTEE